MASQFTNQYIKDGKIKKFKVKRHHGFSAVLFVLGTLFPPLAVAARFGIGTDFWLNLLLTICGYIPGHVHNFYIQNVRNNNNKRRTPKWAIRYGLLDVSELKRKQKKSEWANRYNDRLPHSTLEGQEFEEGEVPDAEPERLGQNGTAETRPGQQFWREEDESFYSNGRGNGSSESGGRWSYPANFNDVIMPDVSGGKKKKVKKDRFARTEDAYSLSEETNGKKKKKKKNRSTVGQNTSDFIDPNRSANSVNDPDAFDVGYSNEAAVDAFSGRGEQRDELEHEF